MGVDPSSLGRLTNPLMWLSPSWPDAWKRTEASIAATSGGSGKAPPAPGGLLGGDRREGEMFAGPKGSFC